MTDIINRKNSLPKLTYIARMRIPSRSANSLQIMRMCEAFARNGIEIELIIHPNWMAERKFTKQEIFDYYDIKTKFRITKLLIPDMMFLLKYFNSPFIRSIIKRIHQYCFCAASLIGILFRGADIVFTRDSMVAFLAGFFKPVIYECHGKINSKMLQFFDRKAPQKCELIIAISQNVKEYLVEQGAKEKDVYVLHDGVNLSKYTHQNCDIDIRELLNISKTEKLIVYTGHLYPYKGVYTLVDAAYMLPGQIILVGGHHEDVQKLRDYVSQKSLRNVLVVGYVQPSEVSHYQRAADVLVLPNSLNDSLSLFSSPLKLFEYMASEKPIVASDLSNIREILDESNAILVEPDNAKELANGIIRALSNEKLAKSISSNAYEKVQQYTWENRVSKILSLINEVGL